jgi:hypothetical protein
MTTCREARPLLPLFFDGELEARQMRAVALHSTRCSECEHELRELEHLQEAISAHVSSLVDTIDVSQVWAGVAPRLASRAVFRIESWPSLDSHELASDATKRARVVAARSTRSAACREARAGVAVPPDLQCACPYQKRLHRACRQGRSPPWSLSQKRTPRCCGSDDTAGGAIEDVSDEAME